MFQGRMRGVVRRSPLAVSTFAVRFEPMAWVWKHFCNERVKMR